MNKILLLILILASWVVLGGLVIAQEKPAEVPSLKLPQVKSQTGVLNLGDFSGGLNLKDYPTQIKNNQGTIYENCWWDGKEIKRRKGYTHFSLDDSAVGINGLFRFYRQEGIRLLMVGGDTALYYAQDDSTTFNKIKSDIPSGNFFDFVAYKDNVVITKKNMRPVYFDGSAMSNFGVVDSGIITWDTGAIDDSEPNILFRKIVCKGKAWDVNEWAGYVYQKVSGSNNEPYGNYAFIWSNSAETLFFGEIDQRVNYVSGSEDDTFRIWAYWYDKPFFEGVAETVWIEDGAVTSAWQDFDIDSTDHWFANKTYVIEGTDRELNGYRSFITDNVTVDTGDVFQVNDVDHTELHKYYYGVKYKVYERIFYQPQYCQIFQNSLFLAGDSTTENIVYYTESNEINNFAPSNLVYIGGADKITGLVTFYSDQGGFRATPQDILLIPKENSLYGLNSNLIPFVIAQGIGAVAPQSIVSVEGLFVGFAHSTGYYGTDGNKVFLLSENIKPFWDNINPLAMDKIAGGYYDKHLILSIPYDTCTYNCTTLVYNVVNKSWGGANLSASVFTNQWGLEDTVKFLWGSPDGGFINRYGVSDFDDGDTITLYYKSKEFDLGDLSQRKTFRNMLIAYDMTSPIILALDFYINFGASATWSTSFTDSGKDIKRVNISPSVVGKTLSWGLSSNDPNITIGNVKINFQLLGGY